MKAMSIRLVVMQKCSYNGNIASVSAKCNPELLLFATRNGAERAFMGNRFIETIPPTYLGFASQCEKAIVLYCCKVVSDLDVFSLELQKKLAEAW